MEPSEQAREEARQVRGQLRVAIQRAGLSLREVEQRLGRHKDYLRQVLGGTIELRYEHVAGILAALGVPPLEFFAEVYGAPRGDQPQPTPPPYLSTASPREAAELRALVRLLQEKGIVSRAEVHGVLGSAAFRGASRPPWGVPVDPPGQVHDEGQDQEKPD